MSASVAAEDDREDKRHFPSLPPEIALLIVCRCPVSSLRCALSVARDWAAAASYDELWLVILQRRWPEFRLQADGRFTSAKSAFHCLRLLGDDAKLYDETRNDSPAPCNHAMRRYTQPIRFPNEYPRKLSAMNSKTALRFVDGMINGYMPASDGCFTYHEEGATPIHYRHSCNDTTFEEGYVLGAWQWSPDRVEWFSCSTLEISRGAFADIGFKLVDATAEIVEFLAAFPYTLPFFTAPCTPVHDCPLDGAWWRRRLKWCEVQNQVIRNDFELAVYTDEPSVPCLARRTFTVHQLFEPPIIFGVQTPPDAAVEPGTEDSTCVEPRHGAHHEWIMELLVGRVVVVPVPGPFGTVNRTVRLWEHLHEVERELRLRLGVLMEEAEADAESETSDMSEHNSPPQEPCDCD